ncbi:AraC family transcriptional regulator [Echinicola soli]|uniref:AraC family transcriptional regulator n=1 Tax=Echinicola soli TaxID=2591634 RepID=A0A514CEW4_9BACT|nr:helix-turn-helix domain-containing protein [Echinicola soli]QDH78290.1 AraC family transcriptional regulator [Echinicola soli]
MHPPIHTNPGMTVIKDYDISYELISMECDEEFKVIFPRIGYLVLNIFIGDGLSCRFLNYSQKSMIVNKVYMTGLFTDSSLHFGMNHNGKGYAIKIHPVIGYHILKCPMREMTNMPVMISEVLEKEGKHLSYLENNVKVKSIHQLELQKAFMSLLPDKSSFVDDPIFHIVNEIIRKKGLINVKRLGQQACMSERTLNRHFLHKVGISVQAYAKIIQLEYAIFLLRSAKNRSLSEIAFEAGYYDVAHLAHDFKSKVSLTPSGMKKDDNPLASSYLDRSTILH